MPKKSKHLEFDSPWKDMIELYFKAFLQFFVPHLHAAIDWSRGYEFLDKELQKVVREAVTQSRRVDKLVKVWLSNQEEILLYIHLEVQGQVEANFAQRMFIYHYRLYDRYGAQVMSLAILGDKKAAWRPQSYHYDQFGCRLTFQFPIIKLLDYQEQWAQLKLSHNPFSHVVQVHLKGLETQQHPQQRLKGKIQLYQSLVESHYTPPEILELFRFLDWVLVLPEELTLEFDQFIHHYEKAKQMRYVTSIERHGIQKGLEQGLLQQAQEAVVKVLQVRFTQLPKQLIEQLQQVKDRDQLSQLLEQAVLVNSLQEFESLFNHK
ncbi:hypothetical protein THII_3844 [Thioploca ingrica]|uniref:Cytosolic protein n=1 Tax=Thioploca ingrica TaxID=40754 RepID=A0A090BW80_9GAMM|nr:hypothetical protein THII_3844 [Thioploca ingrica]